MFFRKPGVQYVKMLPSLKKHVAKVFMLWDLPSLKKNTYGASQIPLRVMSGWRGAPKQKG